MKPVPIANMGKCRCKDRKSGSGPAGTCSCPVCGKKMEHAAGVSCANLRCQSCGNRMSGSGRAGLGSGIPTMPFGGLFR